METNDQLKKMLEEALDPAHLHIKAPPLERMNHLRERVAARRRIPPPRPDLFSVLASFLNVKIKLYHAVFIFSMMWTSYLLLQKDPVQKQEIINENYSARLAAVNNATVLSSIQTYILRK